jgi:hypothetical protein
MNETLKLEDIQRNDCVLDNYIHRLNTNCKKQYGKIINLGQLRDESRKIIPELPTNNEISNIFRNYRIKGDKGIIGKVLEYSIFGLKPNNESKPDLFKCELKMTHVSIKKNGNFNAKERLTIANCGSLNNYSTFQDIVNEDLQNSKCYSKLKNILLFVCIHDKQNKIENLNDIFTKKIFTFFRYDINQIPNDWKDIIFDDYTYIQQLIRLKSVTQKGQQFLHIHKHGCRKSKTCALGFKNRFVTLLIAYNISTIYNISISEILHNKKTYLQIKKEFIT